MPMLVQSSLYIIKIFRNIFVSENKINALQENCARMFTISFRIMFLLPGTISSVLEFPSNDGLQLLVDLPVK